MATNGTNAVRPGYIDTPMMGRFIGGTPEGRAKVIAEEPVGRWQARGNRRGHHLPDGRGP
jgi:NAD(P)-dependent dehydrogenase (short-subunit alcohol dehydrogenase family)